MHELSARNEYSSEGFRSEIYGNAESDFPNQSTPQEYYTTPQMYVFPAHK
jgi:hypothetical protein